MPPLGRLSARMSLCAALAEAPPGGSLAASVVTNPNPDNQVRCVNYTNPIDPVASEKASTKAQLAPYKTAKYYRFSSEVH
jgi:hypothetical protein